MAVEGLSAAEAQHSVRQEREQIQIRGALNEQLVLFGMCDYQPREDHPIYRRWLLERAER